MLDFHGCSYFRVDSSAIFVHMAEIRLSKQSVAWESFVLFSAGAQFFYFPAGQSKLFAWRESSLASIP